MSYGVSRRCHSKNKVENHGERHWHWLKAFTHMHTHVHLNICKQVCTYAHTTHKHRLCSDSSKCLEHFAPPARYLSEEIISCKTKLPAQQKKNSWGEKYIRSWKVRVLHKTSHLQCSDWEEKNQTWLPAFSFWQQRQLPTPSSLRATWFPCKQLTAHYGHLGNV